MEWRAPCSRTESAMISKKEAAILPHMKMHWPSWRLPYSRSWRTQFENMALSISNMALLYLADDYFKCPLPTRLPRSSFCVYKCVNIEKYIGDAGSSKMILGRLLSLCNQYRQFINLALYSKRRFF